MVTTFISLLGSLAQANFVWNGDIVLNVAMAGGGVDWLGLLGLAIIIGVVWVIAARFRLRHCSRVSGTQSSEGVSHAICSVA